MGWFQQAQAGAEAGETPMLVIRADGGEPYAVVRYRDLLMALQQVNHEEERDAVLSGLS